MPVLADERVDAPRAFALTAILSMACGITGVGCLSPNVYGTPRTLAPGATSHTLAPESVTGFTHGRVQSSQIGRSSDGSIVLPSYTLRVGLMDRADMGIRAAQQGLWGVDFKLNALKSRVVDLAVDPTAQMVLDGSTAHLHLPGIVGFNVAEGVSIVVTPGISYVSNLEAGLYIGDDRDQARVQTHGLLGRLGAGVSFRFLKRYAIQPEATVFRSLQPSNDAPYRSITWLALGIGLTLGAQPSFADEHEDPSVSDVVATPAGSPPP